MTAVMDRDLAAVTIQRCARGLFSRRIKRYRKDLLAYEAAVTPKALKIQSFYRGYKGRQVAKSERELKDIQKRRCDKAEQQQLWHSLWYLCVPPAASPASRRSAFLLQAEDILQLRATCRWVRDFFGVDELRLRLRHTLSTKPLPRRTVNGNVVELLTFDDQIDEGGLLAAVCVTEAEAEAAVREETGEVIALAAQCGICQLPVRITSADLHQFPNKGVYLALPRVLAQLTVVGRHINFGNDISFQLFHRGHTVRAIRDQDGFELTTKPTLPPDHLYEQHRQDHDPPTRSPIVYGAHGWRSHLPRDYSSASSLVKNKILDYFKSTQSALTTLTFHLLGRGVDENQLLNTILSQSPHTPVEGCSTTASFCSPTTGIFERRLVLTDASHPFVAWLRISRIGTYVQVLAETTEPDRDPLIGPIWTFQNRFRETAQLARLVLGPVIAAELFDKTPAGQPTFLPR
ncbi:unnamed protein product [Vitrella brassicaformis CCMP3155]|uniref:Uncharacterized protein n=1 Tax=Vitrella brassicaformis (strain CCMP3155) TaxID=1169540 RepID=A0A0G4FSV6_VITBC|nr:unnamed protein product [Vitrella brassicaformis CCMP3155]|eukprot:CEM17394.1 unnamed protein product [Vitrella brassicaformis CCMP3155]